MAKAGQKKSIVSRFLERCDICGTFRGEVALEGSESAVRVVCRCSNGRCPRCKRPVVTEPFSASHDDIGGKTWHAPVFSATCKLCGPLFMANFSDFNIGDSH